jgi:AcrR family transcriptional regulator
MSSQKRPYELKERAKQQRETRRRIVAATAELHEEVGPARTTIAEIARRAGVQRLTVYKHFPAEEELFEACSGHFIAAHPRPHLSQALALEDPPKRVEAVLGALYGWYRETEAMATNIQRDRLLLPAIDERAAITIDEPMAGLAATLASGFGAREGGADRVRALVAVALDFWTWRRLKLQGLTDAAAAELMAAAIDCAATASR